MTRAQQPSEFERFRALTQRIVTTPKAELLKQAEKPKRPAAKKAGKKKG